MEVAQILRVLRRGWYLVVVAVILAVGGALIVTARTTPVYVASARLFVATSQEKNPNALIPADAFISERIASYVAVADSPLVAQRVIDQLHLTNVSATGLAGEISATAPTTGSIMDVSVRDASPTIARDVANTIGQELNDAVNQLQNVSSTPGNNVKVSVLKPASLPTSPASPNRSRNVELALVLGLLLGVGIALLRNALDVTLRISEDLEDVAGDVPMLGTIPFEKSVKRDPIVLGSGGHGGTAEAFRQLRTNLRFIGPRSQGRVFVVTSSVQGEGKSVTTANLAVALAQAGSTVCVVDADLRRPRQADYLGVDRVPGLTNVLSGQMVLDDALQERAGEAPVTVLASGTIPPNPSELLGSEGMEDVLTKLRESYDYVLIDSAPLLPVTDAAVLAPLTDGALLLVTLGQTKRTQVRRSTEALGAVDARLVGLVTRTTSRLGRGSGYVYQYVDRADAERSESPSGQPEAGADEAGAGRRARR